MTEIPLRDDVRKLVSDVAFMHNSLNQSNFSNEIVHNFLFQTAFMAAANRIPETLPSLDLTTMTVEELQACSDALDLWLSLEEALGIAVRELRTQQSRAAWSRT